MIILHTADWHIGQLFYEYDRTFEHEQFLQWLKNTLVERSVDVLLISGDVFDNGNPSAASVKMFYRFLRAATKAQPNLQIVVTAGNHDSAARLESPKPLLEDDANIHIIGTIDRLPDGCINYQKLVFPLANPATGETAFWLLAIPYLRLGDYPQIVDSATPYADGITAMYHEAYQYAHAHRKAQEPILAMGHLHAVGATTFANDKSERAIMGGVECVPVTAFNENIVYTALGHIHKAQMIAHRPSVRYPGSPIPMSFSEANYHHQVVLVSLQPSGQVNIEQVSIPVSVSLLRVPTKAAPLPQVLAALANLPEKTDQPAPYLEVSVLLDGPEPALRHKVETAIEHKQVRLARIEVTYLNSSEAPLNQELQPVATLQDLTPKDVLEKIFHSRYKTTVPDNLLSLFHEAEQLVGHE